MSRVGGALAIALGLGMLAACAQTAPSPVVDAAASADAVAPQPVQVEGRYVHAASGMAFPDSIGDFRRTAVVRRDASGNAVSATYDFVPAQGGIVAAVDIFPAPAVAREERWAACAASYFRPQRDVLRLHPGARMVEEDTAAPSLAGTGAPGIRAVFEYEDTFRGTRQLVQSRLYAYCFVGGRWMVRYTFSYAPAIDTATRIAEFMSSLQVTVAARS